MARIQKAITILTHQEQWIQEHKTEFDLSKFIQTNLEKYIQQYNQNKKYLKEEKND